MQIRSLLAAIATTFAFASAHASVITVSTGYTNTGPLASAAAYQSAVDAAVAIPTAGYGSTNISLYDNVSNQSLFGGSNGHIAFKSTIDFNVSNTNTGLWDFRFGVDFGWGGAVFLDGVALAFNNADMWWNGSYGNPTQFLSFSSILGEGNHELLVYGMEGCCDGGQQAQFRSAGSNNFVTFSVRDGISPVSEPASLPLIMSGFALTAAMIKRRKA